MPELKTIPVGKIRPSPFQPRETFDKRLIEELADSMKNVDLLQPIIVRPHKGGFQIAAGEVSPRATTVYTHPGGWTLHTREVKLKRGPKVQNYFLRQEEAEVGPPDRHAARQEGRREQAHGPAVPEGK